MKIHENSRERIEKKKKRRNTNTLNVEYKRHGAFRTPTAAEKENASVHIVTSMCTQIPRKIRLVVDRDARHCVANFQKFSSIRNVRVADKCLVDRHHYCESVKIAPNFYFFQQYRLVFQNEFPHQNFEN